MGECMNQTDLLNSLFTNKKNLIILIIIYLLVVGIILFFIWRPEKVLDIAKYKPYNEESIKDEMLKYYVQELQKMKINYDFNEFTKCIDDNYLYYKGITAEEAYGMLQKTKNQFSVQSYSVYRYGNDYIYSVELPTNDGSLKVNIIEEDYPYNFRISYGSFVEYSSTPKLGTNSGIKLMIDEDYHDLNYVEYVIEITNSTKNELSVDLSDSLNTYLTLKNDEKVYVDIEQIDSHKEKVRAENSIKLKLKFNIGIAKQNDIKTLTMSDIFDGERYKYVSVNI